MHPIRIAPSLLACDFANLETEVGRAEAAGADWLHLDVMDGHFVPNITIGPAVLAAIKRVARCPLDVHLMIQEPDRYADAFLDAGADVLSFHLEVADRIDAQALIAKVKARGAKAGMAINPDARVQDLEPYLPELDMVLVMSVFPGFGGQEFMAGVLDRVRALGLELGFGGEIQMDGGIGPDTIQACSEAGANVFVAGTGIFGAPDLAQRIADLRQKAKMARVSSS